MTLAPEAYTATLAGLYASQGHLEKAAEVYRYLLARTPERQDLAGALSDLEARMAGEGQLPANGKGERDVERGTENEIKTLLEEWVTLLLEANKMSAIKKRGQRIKQY